MKRQPTHQLIIADEPYDITIESGYLVQTPRELWALTGLSESTLKAQCRFRGWTLNKKAPESDDR